MNNIPPEPSVPPRNPFEHLETPINTQELSREFIDKWVAPFYMVHLHNADVLTLAKLAKASNEINIDILKMLLDNHGLRERRTAALFAAINLYKEFEENIGIKLLKSEQPYAGAYYCFALANFKTAKAKQYLITYLEYYLERNDLDYDQITAFCALDYLDTKEANKLLLKLNAFADKKEGWNLEQARTRFLNFLRILNKIREYKALSVR